MAPKKYVEPFSDEHRANIGAASKKWWDTATKEEKAELSLKRSEAWKRLSDDERERRLAGLRSYDQSNRSPETRRKMSEAQKKLWHEGGPKFQERTCHVCAQSFIPNSGHQLYCSRECKWLARRLLTHGITPEDYWTLFEKQDGRCALCRKVRFGWGFGSANLHIDHCHDTGKVRGLLCGNCNTALGRFGDDPEKLRAAALYLEGASLPE